MASEDERRALADVAGYAAGGADVRHGSARREPEDLAVFIGSRSRASEILSGKRLMTLEQIRRVARALGVPVSLLVGVHEPATV